MKQNTLSNEEIKKQVVTVDTIETEIKNVRKSMLKEEIIGLKICTDNLKDHNGEGVVKKVMKCVSDNDEDNIIGSLFIDDKIYKVIKWSSNSNIYISDNNGNTQDLKYAIDKKIKYKTYVEPTVKIDDDFTQFKGVGDRTNPFDTVKEGIYYYFDTGYDIFSSSNKIKNEYENKILDKLNIYNRDKKVIDKQIRFKNNDLTK